MMISLIYGDFKPLRMPVKCFPAIMVSTASRSNTITRVNFDPMGWLYLSNCSL